MARDLYARIELIIGFCLIAALALSACEPAPPPPRQEINVGSLLGEMIQPSAEACLQGDLDQCDHYIDRYEHANEMGGNLSTEPVVYLRDTYLQRCREGDAGSCTSLSLLLDKQFGANLNRQGNVDDTDRLWWHACFVLRYEDTCNAIRKYEPITGNVTEGYAADYEAGHHEGLFERVGALIVVGENTTYDERQRILMEEQP